MCGCYKKIFKIFFLIFCYGIKNLEYDKYLDVFIIKCVFNKIVIFLVKRFFK